MPRTKAPPERRRNRGEGTEYKKTRTWTTSDGRTRSKELCVVEISEGYAGSRGKHKRVRRRFYGATYAEARAKRNQFLLEKGKPVPLEAALPDDRTTVAELATQFIEDWSRIPRRDGKAHARTTMQSYSNTLRVHVVPHIGKIRVADFTPDAIRGFYKSLEGKVSPSMRARVHRTLRVMLKYAVVHARLIEQSPIVEAIREIAPRHKRPPIEPLNERQVAALLQAARGHRIADAMIPLALDSGMRQGELIGLRWDDLDLARGKLHVSKSASEVGGEIKMESPKSGSGRTIQLSGTTVSALKRRKATARREGLIDCELVFPGERGRPLYKSNFLRETWGPLRTAAGIPNARFHDLRHTCATMLLKANVHPKVVQERLGHSSIVLTMDTYSAFIPSLQADAAKAMGRVLGRLGRRKSGA